MGKENLFIFGMDESEVPAWRESKRAEWKDYDPRFVKAIEMVRDGTFGDKEYFQVRNSFFRIRADNDGSCMKGKQIPWWKLKHAPARLSNVQLDCIVSGP